VPQGKQGGHHPPWPDLSPASPPWLQPQTTRLCPPPPSLDLAPTSSRRGEGTAVCEEGEGGGGLAWSGSGEVGRRRVEAGCEGRGEEWGGSVVPALAYSVCGLGRQVERERVVEVKGGDRICRQLAVEAGT
jgi:hypothetical protein